MRYFNSIKNTMVTSMALLLMVLSLISCEKRDEYYGTGNGYSETIGFRIIDHNIQTRNALAVIDNEKIVNKFILRSEDGMDSLHLTQYESDINAPFNIQTRASKFNDLSSGFFVYGYNFADASDANYDDLFISNKKAIVSDSKWAFSPSEYWPSGESQFFCYANAPTSGFSISTEDGAPKMTYTMPSSLTDHKDIVVARSNRYPANTESVPLTFEHPLTSVEFKIGTVGMPGTINKVTISGIYTTGKLNLGHPSESFQVMGAWTYPSSKTNFSQDVQVSLTEGKNGNDIATLDNNYAFMMVPQTLEGAKLTINYTYGDKTKDLDAKLIGTWSPGKRVTYTLTTKEILDIWFNNTTEICLDAHYVMSEVLDIHVGEACTWELTVPTDCDWLKFQTNEETGFSIADHELSDLQKDGWWIIDDVEDKATKTLTSNLVGESLKIVLVATENSGTENRSTIITLSSGETSEPFIITQMCPHWIDVPATETSPAKTIGAERIEEEPLLVPWGQWWRYDGDEEVPTYTVSYPSPIWSGAFWESLVARAWQSFAGVDNVTSEGLLQPYIFNYSNIIESIKTGTSDPNNGLNNTTNGYSNEIEGVNGFRDYLINAGSSPSGFTFTEFDYEYSAFLDALRKNAFNRKTQNDAVIPDIDLAKSNDNINWYLPAVNEAASGVYQENLDGHACETSFLNKNENGEVVDGKVYWTSTSVDAEHAYTYQYGSTTTTPPALQKDGTYHVRAIRRKTN